MISPSSTHGSASPARRRQEAMSDLILGLKSDVAAKGPRVKVKGDAGAPYVPAIDTSVGGIPAASVVVGGAGGVGSFTGSMMTPRFPSDTARALNFSTTSPDDVGATPLSAVPAAPPM